MTTAADLPPRSGAPSIEAERSLVERCLSGETAARRQLVELYHRGLRQAVAFAAQPWGELATEGDIDDAVQQTFLVLFARDAHVLRRWRSQARLRTYLGRVAERVAARHFSALATRRARFRPLLTGGEAETPGGDEDTLEAALDALVLGAQAGGALEAPSLPLAALEEAETRAAVRAELLGRLSEKGRDFYQHLFVDELDLAEICVRERTNPNNVYQWRSRILREAAAVWSRLRDEFR
jgi:RNA polymerase sigma factor (sigma-70 family)